MPATFKGLMMDDVKAKSGPAIHHGPEELAVARGVFTFELFDKHGNLKLVSQRKNLVVNTGLQNMAGTAFDGVTLRITSWYMGLYGSGATNSPASTDTGASHPGWVEITTYTQSGRPQAVFANATAANPSVISNSANKATFDFSTTGVLGGAFISQISTKGSNTGTLFSASDLTGGDINFVNGDSLQLTYSFSLAA